MLFQISVYGLVSVLIVSIFLCIFPIRLSRQQLIVFWVIYIIFLAILGFHIEPGRDLDLYRIYQEINGFRREESAIFDSAMFVMNIFYYLVAKTPNNGWIVVVTVAIWGGCIYKIVAEYLSKNNYSTRAVILYYVAANGGCFIFYLITGIRCSLVCALWVYAYYLWYGKKRYVYYLIMLMTMFMHIIGPILIGFTSLYHLLKNKGNLKIYIIIFSIILAIGYIFNVDFFMDMLSNFTSTYGTYVSEKIMAYSIRGYEFQQGREMMFRILISLLYFILIMELHYKGIKEYEIIGFMILVMYAGFNISILFERIPYVLGIASLPILNESSLSKKFGRRMIFYIVATILLFAQLAWGVYEILIWTHFKGDIYYGNLIRAFFN